MGDGHPPGPTGTSGETFPVDTGTLAVTLSPTPDGIGLDSSEPTGPAAALADAIVSYARNRLGVRVGDGQCFALVDEALRNAGARSAADYGAVTPTANYVWGDRINLSQLRPGDVIQFRNYRYSVDRQTPAGSETLNGTRPHHSAIVEAVGAHGIVTVLEQNVPEDAPVQRAELYFTAGTFTEGETTTTVTIHGRKWYYRPQPR